MHFLFPAKSRFLLPLFCLTAISLFSGCPMAVRYADLDEDLGRASWGGLEAMNAQARQDSGPYNASVSLRLNLPSGSYLLGAYIWSNGALESHLPLRLDLQNAMGGTEAKLRENTHDFLIYDLRNNRLISSSSPQEALQALNIFLPVSLGELSLLLNGRYADFFRESYLPPLLKTTQDRQSILLLEQGARQGHLTLNAEGYPQRWESTAPEGWIMEMEYQDPVVPAGRTPLPGPRRIVMEHADGYAVSIQVKNLKKLPQPFTETQLDLLVPAGVGR